ncbi:hypothetical protein ACLFMI_14365 [Pseudonocardia nantongensis]|uniref:hypothetical protein n=1 Tax=Pseudonocardia nantongensis TaxID=1181885 RepID=UPI0039785C56
MSALDVDTLWLHCASLASVPSLGWLVAVLDNSQPRTAHEHDVVAQALNDTFIDAAQDHPVRYAAQLS